MDIRSLEEIKALRSRLAGRRFTMLFSNAGTADANQDEPILEVPVAQFIDVMVTNALGTMRVIETLQDLVSSDGLLGAMSSGQGSVSCNTTGGHETYRGSKAALNMYMRSFAARRPPDPRAMALIAPGWVRTRLGGPKAPLAIEDSIPKVAEVLLAQLGKPGLRFLDRDGQDVPW